MSEIVVTRPRPGVTRVAMNRPERLNAMTAGMIEGLHAALAEAAADPECRVVVLTGAGRGFCAGLDLGGYGEPAGVESAGAVQRGLATQRHIAGLVQRIRRMPQPVVAEVNGAAAGGGLALVLASDLRIASTSAVFAVSFMRVGFSACDIGTSWMLPRLVGAGRAHELMMTARRFDAEEALRIGMLADAVAPDELSGRVGKALDDLLSMPPLSLSLTKQAMWLSLEIPSFDAAVELENRQQVLTMMTADQTEAMTAYMEKRAPDYGNR
ncbi:enoyl-CoA hydratase/isomerase family protein [Actinomadura montaniterrae]|uniref:Enoyl-CoA hydratase/isomerase family protein n=1 Tax=Actinomadura montaniterrae TaxID=1803903 RepID=A0A6L3VM53_9ACTN|nr:enoyl-CoA hydratase-related protein [Actinomadura montaniterrae]KAB2368190.1 enoyl-CoA hydratase/isomerase family protein [Actinomadura montaniterrae]